MNFKIRNFKKVKQADIEVKTITCIAGDEMSGKTSTLLAIRSILAGTGNLHKNLTKKQMSMNVRSGSPSGHVVMLDGENEIARIDWPECKYTAGADHKTYSSLSVGSENLVYSSVPQRAKYVQEILKALPSQLELVSAIKKIKIFPVASTIGTEKSFIDLWKSLDINGWDVVYQKIRTSGTELKGAWRQITGLNYGVRVAESYEPDNFTEDLKSIEKDVLESDVRLAREWCEAAQKQDAISDSEIKRLKTVAATLTDLENAKLTIVSKDKALERSLQDLVVKDCKEEKRGLICPSCQTKLTLSNGSLKKIPVEEDISENKIVDLKKDIESIKAQQKLVTMEFGENRIQINDAAAAAKKISEIQNQTPKTAEKNIEDASEKLAIAIERLEASTKYHDAHNTNDKLIIKSKIVKILAPEGLRAEVLKTKIGKLNQQIKKITDIAGWETIEVDYKSNILVDGYSYDEYIHSDSQAYRARFILQVVVALIEKTNIVILDSVIMLSKKSRGDLLKTMATLTKLGLKFIFAFTCQKDEIPPVGKMISGGKSYYLVDGSVT